MSNGRRVREVCRNALTSRVPRWDVSPNGSLESSDAAKCRPVMTVVPAVFVSMIDFRRLCFIYAAISWMKQRVVDDREKRLIDGD